MTTTSSTTESLPPAPTSDTSDKTPWPALLVLGGATLVMVTGEMMPIAVLAPMSTGLGVSESATGLLVSSWAAIVVVASFPLVRLTRRFARKRVVTASLLAFALSSALTALAPSYAVVAGARLLGAAAVGLLWSTVNALVADLVSDRLLGRATAVVLGGATLGMVLGTPLGRFIADLTHWRLAFAMLAVIGVLAALMVGVVVPEATDPTDGAEAAAAATPHPGIVPVIVLTGLVALALVGHYGAFTYLTRIGEPAGDVLPGGLGSLLLAFGFASAAGVVLAGRVTERTAAALVTATGATAVSLAALGLSPEGGGTTLVMVIAWGVVSGTLGPLAQTLVMRTAGTAHRSTAGALLPVLFNGGIAVGAAGASALVSLDGVQALPLPAAALAALSAAGLAAVTLRRAWIQA